MRDFRQSGMSLIEVLVGLVIGLVAILVIGQVTAAFEAQKRTSTGGGDAQTNGAAALQVLEQEVRMAGFGLTVPALKGTPNGNLLCPLGVNVAYNGTILSNPGTAPPPSDGGILAPVRIVDGAAGEPDVVVMVRSDAEFGALMTNIVTSVNLALPAPVITVNSSLGYETGQLILVASGSGSKVCTLLQVSKAPTLNVDGFNWDLEFAAGSSFPYNLASPGTSYASFIGPGATTYGGGDKIVNLGLSRPPPASNVTTNRSFMYRRYGILGLNGETGCGDQPTLTMVDPSQVSAPYTCANSQALADQIVDLQAQYGIAPAGSQTVNEWKDATGAWASNVLTAAQIGRIKAVRIAVVSRSSQFIKNDAACTENPVATADIALWEKLNAIDDEPPKYTIPVGGDGCQHYRYKVFNTVAPLKNVIWGQLP